MYGSIALRMPSFFPLTTSAAYSNGPVGDFEVSAATRQSASSTKSEMYSTQLSPILRTHGAHRFVVTEFSFARAAGVSGSIPVSSQSIALSLTRIFLSIVATE